MNLDAVIRLPSIEDKDKNKDVNIESSHIKDSDWELPDDVEPLVNVVSFGWMEDGRCGYPLDKNSGKLLGNLFGSLFGRNIVDSYSYNFKSK